MAWLPRISRLAVCMAAVWLATASLLCERCGAGGLLDLPPATASFPNLDAIKTNALAGNANAQFKLGDCYFSSGDFTNATVWYRKAAEQGLVNAQLSLSSCYTHGRGVGRDPVLASYWSQLATTRAGRTTNGTLPPQAKPSSESNRMATIKTSAAPSPDVSAREPKPADNVEPASAPKPKAAPAAVPSPKLVVRNGSDPGGRIRTLDVIVPQVQEAQPAFTRHPSTNGSNHNAGRDLSVPPRIRRVQKLQSPDSGLDAIRTPTRKDL